MQPTKVSAGEYQYRGYRIFKEKVEGKSPFWYYIRPEETICTTGARTLQECKIKIDKALGG